MNHTVRIVITAKSWRATSEVLWDEPKALLQFKDCVSQLESKLNSFAGDRGKADRLRIFTSHVLPSQKQRPRGKVKVWNRERGFGFVRADDGQDVFVHYTAIREEIHKYLTEGDHVEFDLLHADRGLQARDLRILPKH